MVKREVEKIKEVIKKLFEERNLSLNKIILFGSYIKNQKSNDIDIIIVSRNFNRKKINERYRMIRGINRTLVKKTMKPVDTMFYSDKEWKSGNSLIINAAKRTGKTIYSS